MQPVIHAEAKGKSVLLLVPGTAFGLSCPETITAVGVAAVTVAGEQRAVLFASELALNIEARRYSETSFKLTKVDDLSESKGMVPGLKPTIEIADVLPALRVKHLRREAISDIRLPVVIHGRETHMYDDELTSDMVVALCWLLATITEGDPNVLISEHLHCTRDAAAQRLARARRAGLVPPADQKGQRKARA